MGIPLPDLRRLMENDCETGPLPDLPSELPIASDVGRTLGQYFLVRELGRGGMAVVYEAEDLLLRRRVAVKVFPAAQFMEPRRWGRFRLEAHAAAMLEHPHIVRAYAYQQSNDVHYITMQLVRGCNLSQVVGFVRMLRRGKSGTLLWQAIHGIVLADEGCDELADGNSGSLPPATQKPVPWSGDYFVAVAQLAAQAADALHYAHENDVVHRDIKPSNLLVDLNGNLWVTDFGLARLGESNQLTSEGELLGTLRYASPEQVLGDVIDRRTDIYSLGTTLYELATLQPAFAGQRAQVAHQIPSREVEPPRRVDPTVPRDLETIILKAMAKAPGARYQSCAEMAEDLRRFARGEPPRAQRTSLLKLCSIWLRKHPTVAVVLAASLLIAIGVLGHFRVMTQKEQMVLRLHHELDKSLGVAQRREAEASYRQRILEDAGYATDLRDARDALERGDPHEALRLLETHLPASGGPDLRGIEWHYLRRRCESVAGNVTLSTRALYFAEYSPDGQYVAAAGADGIVYLLDAATFTERGRIATEQREVNGLAFASAKSLLATTGDDGTVRLWKVPEGTLVRTLHAFRQKAFQTQFADGDRLLLVCGRDRLVRIYLTDSGEQAGTLALPAGGVDCMAVAPDSRTVVTGVSNGATAVWDLADYSLRNRFEHSARPTSVQFLGNGDYYCAGFLDRVLRLIHRNEGTLIEYFFPDPLQSVAVEPQSEWLAVGDRRGAIHAFNVHLPEQWELPAEQSAAVWCARAGSAGLAVATDRELRFLDEASGEWQVVVCERSIPSSVDAWRYLDVSAAGSRLIRGSDVYQKHVRGDQAKWEFQGRLPVDADRIGRVRCSPDGRILAIVAEGTCRLFDGETLALRAELNDLPRDVPADIDFSERSGRWALVAGATLTVGDLRTGAPIVRNGAAGAPLETVVFCDNGDRLVTGPRVRFWNVIDAEPAFDSVDIAEHATRLLAFPGRPWLVVAEKTPGALTIWNTATCTRVARLMAPCGGAFDASPAEPEVVWLAHDHCVRSLKLMLPVKDGRQRKATASWKLHDGRVYHLAFSPDRARLLSVGEDGRLRTRLRGIDDSQELYPPPGRHHGLMWFADGVHLLTRRDETTELWSAEDQSIRSLGLPSQDRSLRTAAAPNSRWLVAASDRGQIGIRGVDENEWRWICHEPANTALTLSFDEDSRQIARSSHTPEGLLQIDIYDLPGLALRHQVILGRAKAGFAISPDLRFAAVGQPSQICLYNIHDGLVVARAHLPDHVNVDVVAISPAGLMLAAGCSDRRVLLWDWQSGRTPTILGASRGRIQSLAFSDDGRTLLAGCSAGDLTAWRTHCGKRLFNLLTGKSPIREVLVQRGLVTYLMEAASEGDNVGFVDGRPLVRKADDRRLVQRDGR